MNRAAFSRALLGLSLLWILCGASLAGPPKGRAELGISVSLRPAYDRGFRVTKVAAVLSNDLRTVEQKLGVDDSTRVARGSFADLQSGAYSVRLTVFDQATEVGSASGSVEVESGRANHLAVIFASFESTFLSNLRVRTGLAFDLPSEAQWECACRAGTSTAYSNGTDCLEAEPDDTRPDANLEPLAWYGANWPGQSSGLGTHEVGLKAANAWGLFDMHGNVWELCLDWYGESSPGSVDPLGPASGAKRVAKGGSYHAWPAICRSATRMPAREQFQATGFRIVCNDAPDSSVALYMVVDLAGGPETDRYPVLYLPSPPSDLLSNPAYKTTKLVLRRVPAGVFTMGSPAEELGRGQGEEQRSVTLTRDYYIGVFEATQGQWKSVTGRNPSRFVGEAFPVETITWQSDIRGGSWPPSSAAAE